MFATLGSEQARGHLGAQISNLVVWTRLGASGSVWGHLGFAECVSTCALELGFRAVNRHLCENARFGWRQKSNIMVSLRASSNNNGVITECVGMS